MLSCASKTGDEYFMHAPLMLLCVVGSCFCFRKHVSVINNLIENEFTVYDEVVEECLT